VRRNTTNKKHYHRNNGNVAGGKMGKPAGVPEGHKVTVLGSQAGTQ